MKTLFVLFTLNLICLGVLAQEKTDEGIYFCGQTGYGKASIISLTKNEMNTCDLKIVPSDTN
jgi:hypothetical protein